MSHLRQTIADLSPTERAAIGKHIKKLSGESLEYKMFMTISGNLEIKHRELMKALYAKPNRDAFNAVAKELSQKIRDYVVLKMSKEKFSPLGCILSDIMFCEFFRARHASVTARHALQSAEELAGAHYHYDILDALYNYQTLHASLFKIPLHSISEKRKVNDPKFHKKHKLEKAASDVQLMVDEAKQLAIELDMDDIIHNVFKKNQLTAEEVNIPEFQLRLMTVFRGGVKSTKDYRRLIPIVNKHLKPLLDSNAFAKGGHEAHVGFHYILAHTHFRIREFEEVKKHIQIGAGLLKHGLLSGSIYHPKFINLNAWITSFKGKNRDAIRLLEKSLKNIKNASLITELLNMELNLAVLYFQDKNYAAAKKQYQFMEQTYSGMKDKMFEEWCFKRDLIYVHILHDLGDQEGALTQLQRIRKNYRTFLRKPKYKNARLYMKLVSKVVRNPTIVKTKAFRKLVAIAMTEFEDQEHDIQAVMFFCWLKSKIHERDYYEVLLEELNPGGEKKLPENISSKKSIATIHKPSVRKK